MSFFSFSVSRRSVKNVTVFVVLFRRIQRALENRVMQFTEVNDLKLKKYADLSDTF